LRTRNFYFLYDVLIVQKVMINSKYDD